VRLSFPESFATEKDVLKKTGASDDVLVSRDAPSLWIHHADAVRVYDCTALGMVLDLHGLGLAGLTVTVKLAAVQPYLKATFKLIEGQT